MTGLDFQNVNLPNACLFRFLKFWLTRQIFYGSVRIEECKISSSEGITAERKVSKSIFAKISLQMNYLHFQNINLSNACFFKFLRFLPYPSIFLCVSKRQEAFKINTSEGNTAELKIKNSKFSKNVISNDFFRLPET